MSFENSWINLRSGITSTSLVEDYILNCSTGKGTQHDDSEIPSWAINTHNIARDACAAGFKIPVKQPIGAMTMSRPDQIFAFFLFLNRRPQEPMRLPGTLHPPWHFESF